MTMFLPFANPCSLLSGQPNVGGNSSKGFSTECGPQGTWLEFRCWVMEADQQEENREGRWQKLGQDLVSPKPAELQLLLCEMHYLFLSSLLGALLWTS